MKFMNKKLICLTAFAILASTKAISDIATKAAQQTPTQITVNGKENVVSDVVTEVPENTRNIDFNANWKFYLGDIGSKNPQEKSYNDAHWRTLSLPHDWSIEQDYDRNVSSEIGQLPGGIGWYRKTFKLPESTKGKTVTIDFGGIYCESTVYINGVELGFNPHGYAPFFYDITPYLNYGENVNVISVKVKNITDFNQASTRWYSGSGIYKDVTLVVQDSTHIRTDGTLIEAYNLKKSHTENKENYYADVKTTVTLENKSESADTVSVRTTLLDYKTRLPIEGVPQGLVENIQVGANAKLNTIVEFKVNNPKLWDTKNPNLYYVQTEVLRNNEVIDVKLDRYGFRYFDMYSINDVKAGLAPAVGFYLNGEFMFFEGVCLHHDQGSLGAAQYDDAIFRQVKMMQDMGSNAIRITHNFADEAILRACDEMGMLAIEESFDMWRSSKGNYTNAYYNWFAKASTNPEAEPGMTWAEFNLKTAFRRSHNYPSIIMYSLGNEIPDSKSDNATSIQDAKNLVKWTHEVDATPNDNDRVEGQRRITTIGQDGWQSGGNKEVMAAVEAQGNNYNRNCAGHEKYINDWYYYGSETSSAVKSRGYYKNGKKDVGVTNIAENEGDQSGTAYGKQLSSWDNSSVGWGYTASKSFRIQQAGADGEPMQTNVMYPAGEFVWTGFDYIGEPTPWNQSQGRQPTKSYFGIVDTAGFAKDDYYLYQSQWLKFEEKPIAHIVAHNTWTDQQLLNWYKTATGKYPVRVYTNAPKAELFVQLPDGQVESKGEKAFQKKTYTNFNYTTTYQRSPDNIDDFFLQWELDSYEYKPGTKYFVKIYDEAGKEVQPVQDFVNPSNIQQVTADKEYALDLRVEQTVIDNDGYSLSYIDVGVVDQNGNPCPNATQLVNFDIIQGAESAEIVGVDNGDSTSWERHKDYNGDWRRQLFSGRALVILKSKTTEGVVHLQASADGLQSDVATVYVTDTGDDTPVSSNQVNPVGKQDIVSKAYEIKNQQSIIVDYKDLVKEK